MRVALLLATAVVLGCVAPAPPDATGGGAPLAVGGVALASDARQGALSTLALAQGGAATVAFPPGVLVRSADGRLLPPEGPLALSAEPLAYLPPARATDLTLRIEAGGAVEDVAIALALGSPFVSGDLAVELMKVQRERFPHKTPGHASYGAAMEYFAEEMEALGYEVELNAYPEAVVPVGRHLGPGSLSHVVGYKRGTETPERYLVFGGHFDVVEATTEGAYDNTAGAVATLTMAKALADVTTRHTLVFAMWGGEEDCICGSGAWVARHPELVAFIDGYYNFDVMPLAWPAPAVDPAPLVVTAGPDGPVAAALHAETQEVFATWMASDAQLVLESAAQGQVAGSRVNAQSDHAHFMARGIPVFFPFTSRTEDVFKIIHKESDTLENMTKYALKGIEGLETELTAEEMAQGEAVLADSFETPMMHAFYHALLVDAGVFPVHRGPPAPLLAEAFE